MYIKLYVLGSVLGSVLGLFISFFSFFFISFFFFSSSSYNATAVNAFFEPVVSDLYRMPITGSVLRPDLLFNPNPLLASTISSQGFIGIGGTNYQLGTNANTFLSYTPSKTCVICGKLYTSNTISITKSLDVCNECNSTSRPIAFSTKI